MYLLTGILNFITIMVRRMKRRTGKIIKEENKKELEIKQLHNNKDNTYIEGGKVKKKKRNTKTKNP